MSIASEITRLQTAKAGILSAISAKGVTVPTTATLSDCPELISAISGGGPSPQKPFPMDDVPDFTIVLRLADGIDNPPAYSKGTLTKKPEYEAEWGNVWFLTYESTDWSSLLKEHYDIVAVLGANAGSVTKLSNMCENCRSLASLTLSNLPSVTNLSNMCQGCFVLTSLTLSNLPSVTNLSNMCNSCYALLSLTLGDLPSVTTLTYMCESCFALTSLTLGDLPSVTDLSNMCNNCYALPSLTLGDLPSVMTLTGMCVNCRSLTSLTLGDLPNVTKMIGMCQNCYALTNFLSIYNKVKDKTIAVTMHSDAFTNCGTYTIAGTAELQQIPTSWGGLAE